MFASDGVLHFNAIAGDDRLRISI